VSGWPTARRWVQRAARRLARTFGAGLSGQSAFGRVVLALPLGGLFLYGFYRAGEQITAGLGPELQHQRVGRTDLRRGTACHYHDLLVLMGAAAWMLHLILLPGFVNLMFRPHLFVTCDRTRDWKCGRAPGRLL